MLLRADSRRGSVESGGDQACCLTRAAEGGARTLPDASGTACSLYPPAGRKLVLLRLAEMLPPGSFMRPAQDRDYTVHLLTALP